MYKPILVVSDGHDRRLAAAAVPVDCVAGEAGFADPMQLTLEGLGHICRIAEGQLVAPEQQGVNHCQQSLLGLRDKPGACSAYTLSVLAMLCCLQDATTCMGFDSIKSMCWARWTCVM